MDQLTHQGYVFRDIAVGELASLHYCNELSFAICTAQAEYIPFETFQELFLQISGVIKEHAVKYLLFDKRTLRTFHQPSMEWYFTAWKPAVSALGLRDHFKILPELEWFKAAVSAGKHEILLKSDKDLLAGINISYINSPEEAIDSILQQAPAS